MILPYSLNCFRSGSLHRGIQLQLWRPDLKVASL